MKTITAIIFVALFSIGALAADAKPKYIGMKKAKEIAHQQVQGTIKSSELEKEHGKMIYSFDVKTADGGTTEVNIDAKTGAVIAVTAENAADEAKEKAEDKKHKDKDKD
jgi:3-keto-L-gulonate-6-phosphate decarboxylase